MNEYVQRRKVDPDSFPYHEDYEEWETYTQCHPLKIGLRDCALHQEGWESAVWTRGQHCNRLLDLIFQNQNKQQSASSFSTGRLPSPTRQESDSQYITSAGSDTLKQPKAEDQQPTMFELEGHSQSRNKQQTATGLIIQNETLTASAQVQIVPEVRMVVADPVIIYYPSITATNWVCLCMGIILGLCSYGLYWRYLYPAQQALARWQERLMPSGSTINHGTTISSDGFTYVTVEPLLVATKSAPTGRKGEEASPYAETALMVSNMETPML